MRNGVLNKQMEGECAIGVGVLRGEDRFAAAERGGTRTRRTKALKEGWPTDKDNASRVWGSHTSGACGYSSRVGAKTKTGASMW